MSEILKCHRDPPYCYTCGADTDTSELSRVAFLTVYVDESISVDSQGSSIEREIVLCGRCVPVVAEHIDALHASYGFLATLSDEMRAEAQNHTGKDTPTLTEMMDAKSTDE